VDWHIQALGGQQALDATDVSSAVYLEGEQLPVQMPHVFRLDARHMHDTPHRLLSTVVPDEHVQQLSHIDSICLGSLGSPIYLNARRIDDEVLDPFCQKTTVQPETIATSFVTASYQGACCQAKAPICCLDFLS